MMGVKATLKEETQPLTAEFNIYVDPHAANTVLRCGRSNRNDALLTLPIKLLVQRRWLEELLGAWDLL